MRYGMRLLLVIACLALSEPSFAAAELEEGRPAPEFRAELLGGGKYDSAQQRGRVIVLNFWATWCRPCLEEMPALDAYYRAHRAEGLDLIAVNVDSPADLARIERAMSGFRFPAALAAKARTEDYGPLRRVPITFVIDRQGVLRFDGNKLAKTLSSAKLERLVTPLLRHPRGD